MSTTLVILVSTRVHYTNKLLLIGSSKLCSKKLPTWTDAGEPRGKRGIEQLCIHNSYVCLRWSASCLCCLQESPFAQWRLCTHRVTIIWVLLHRRRQHRWEVHWCRDEWGYAYVSRPPCHCCFRKSSSVRRCRCTSTLVTLLSSIMPFSNATKCSLLCHFSLPIILYYALSKFNHFTILQ